MVISFVSVNRIEIEDIEAGLRIWDKYIRGLKTELLILVPTASEKSTARTNLENKRYKFSTRYRFVILVLKVTQVH